MAEAAGTAGTGQGWQALAARLKVRRMRTHVRLLGDSRGGHLSGSAGNVILLHRRGGSPEGLPIPMECLDDAVRELKALRQCVSRVARYQGLSAQEWAISCTPLILRLHLVRRSLADLAVIRVGTWPDTGWAARLRAAQNEVERRLTDVSASARSLMREETSSANTMINFSFEGTKLADALDGLCGLVVAGSVSTSLGSPTKQIIMLQVTLADLLRAIDDDARRMDANADDTHKLAEEIHRSVQRWVFHPDAPLDAACQPAYRAFEQARVAENDAYEVYADDLERYLKRRRANLSVAESDLDTVAVVRRRRQYITTLLALQTRISAICRYAPEARADSTPGESIADSAE
jgi:hypothetical protein